MKKKHHYRLLFVLLAAGLLCSCGTAAKKEVPRLETYNGFAYTEENGQKKYILETRNDIRLHCFFQSGSEEYEEVIYDLELSEEEGASEKVTRVMQEQGEDLTPSFTKFDFVFYPEKVVMTVERNTDLMAGGDSDNIQTGTYTMFGIRLDAGYFCNNGKAGHSGTLSECRTGGYGPVLII